MRALPCWKTFGHDSSSLARTLPTPVLDNWIRPCRLVAVEGDHLRIGAPNKFSRDWLAQNYLDALHQAAREVLGGHPRITLIVDEAVPAEPVAPPRLERASGGGTVEGLNPRYTFERSSRARPTSSRRPPARRPPSCRRRAYNPLFIYGGVGLGKTHLLHAIGHQ